MKKKLISGIALAAAVAVVGATLCACGDKPTGGKPAANKPTGEEISKEEFLASFAPENYTNVKVTSSWAEYYNGVLDDSSSTTVIIADGSYIYETTETTSRATGNEPTEGETPEYEILHTGYCVISDGTTTKYYTYEYEGDTAPATTWMECAESDFHFDPSAADLAESIIPEVYMAYEDVWKMLAFDSETGRYNGSLSEENESKTDTTNVTFEFNDKKITYYSYANEISETYKSEPYTMKAETSSNYTYGGLSVTAPVAAEQS